MVRENIRFQEGNFTTDGIYYYSMLDGAQVLQQKVDDGTVAFSFPLDTAVTGNIQELEWDGVYFWSMEDRAGGTGVIIRKWAIVAFICQQQQIFELADGPVHTYTSDSFAIEKYALTVGINDNGTSYPGFNNGTTFGLQDINISDTSMLEPGDVLTFVRRFTSSAQRQGTSFVEQVTVQSVLSATQVRLTATMQGDPHGDGRGFRGPDVDIETDLPAGTNPPTPDLVYVTKTIWLANDDSPSNPGTPSLYKIRASNGSNIIQFSGTQYDDVNGLAFYAKYTVLTGTDVNVTPYNTSVVVDGTAGGRQTYLLVARGSTLLFFNTDTHVIDRSLVMNNIKVDTINHWPVFDMEVVGIEPNIILFRLQLGTTYKNPSLVLTNETWSTYNYEKQLLRRVVHSIAVTVEPSIIPANGTAQATATATLRDQYNDAVSAGITVNWTDDAAGDGGLDSPKDRPTDGFGTSTIDYNAGVNEKDVKITASVTNGLLP